MRAASCVLLALLLAPLRAPAQASEVSAPFVSRLKAQAQGASIVLSWQDSLDARGPLAVYRHTAEITAENLGQAARIAEVPYGSGSYTDHPPEATPWYYAVLASDAGGRRYDVLVAFRNKTLAPVTAAAGAAQGAAARITALRAESAQGSIKVSFAATRPDRKLVLYRSTAAITRFADLVGAVALVLDPAVSPYEDTPPAGIPFYYAMADEELVKRGTVSFTPGESATTAAATLPLGPGTAGRGSRTRPLPYLVLERAVYTGEGVLPAREMPPRRELGPRAEEAVAALLDGLAQGPPEAMRPVVLEIDKAATGGGEEFLLHTIATQAVAAGDGAAAEAKLREFLRIRRDARIEARARFYLGQALYFQRRRAEALVEMLFAADYHYAEARPWVERCLEELAATP